MRDRVLSLLSLEEEFVYLQLLDQLRILRVDENRLRATRMVQHIFSTDVFQFRGQGGIVGLVLGELISNFDLVILYTI